jgi:hypothetical protein
MLRVCALALQKVRTLVFYILPNFQESMKGQGMCEMHMSTSWEEVINAYNYSRSSQTKF